MKNHRRSIDNRMDDLRAKLPPKRESVCDVMTDVLMMHQKRDEVRLTTNTPIEERGEDHEVLSRPEMREWVRAWLIKRGDDPDRQA